MPKVVLFFDDKRDGVVFYPSPHTFERIRDTLEENLRGQLSQIRPEPNPPDECGGQHKCDGIPCSMCDGPACVSVVGPMIGEAISLGESVLPRHVTITMPDGATVQIPYTG